jgi:hypothetical protein
MVPALAALLLSSGSMFQPADAGATDLPQLFVSACLDGQAKLSPGSAAAVSFDTLPNDLRASLGTPQSAQVWRLNGAGRGYLYILNYAPGRTTSPRVCGLASDAMNYGAAADMVEMRVTGEVHPRAGQSVQWLSLDGGYNALATTAGDFKVLQIEWLSDEQRAQAVKQFQAVAH